MLALSCHLNKLLNDVHGKPESNMIETLAIRTMSKAVYTTDNIGHYGLAFDYYSHFTSPIRRYPDLMVHRVLKKKLEKGTSAGPLSELPLAEIAQIASVTERRAMEAERDIVKLKKCQFVTDKVGEKFSGMVTSVHAFGFFVELHEIYVEGLVHVSSLEDDFYQYEEERHRLIGMNRRREFSIGSPVEVSVHKVDLDRREIDFRLVEEKHPVRGTRREGRGKRKR